LDELSVFFNQQELDLRFLEREYEGSPWLNAVRQAQSWEAQPSADYPDVSNVALAREWMRAQWKKRVPLVPKPVRAEILKSASDLGFVVLKALKVRGFEPASSCADWVQNHLATLNSRRN
jgi:hypothetical protein